ncbi:hypothetical protein Tco_0304177 [Tanacetum coccineum]
MGRDTIQLEDAVSTISQEYLLEFSSEYYISEKLHPELLGPGDHIVDFPEATASRVIQMVDATELSTSSGTPSTVERSPLDFSNEDAPPPVTQGAEAGVHGPTAGEQEIPVTDDAEATEAAGDAGEGGYNAPAKVLRKDHDAARAEHSARGGKSLADMSVDTEPVIHVPETQEPPVATQSVSDPDPLSYAKPQPNPKQDVAQSSKEAGAARNQDSEKSTPSPSIIGSPRSIYQPGWGVPNDYRLDTPEACRDVEDHIAPPGYFSELRHLPTDEFLSQYNINLARQVAMGSQLRLRFEQEAKLLKKFVAQELEDLINAAFSSGHEVGNAQLSQWVSVLQAQVMGKKRIMAAFEVFKKHEDERVNAQCAKRQDFANVICGDSQGYGEGLKYGAEHGKAGLELTVVEAYDPKADRCALYVNMTPYIMIATPVRMLSDYPLPSARSSLPDQDSLYPEVRGPRNPWACKEEILLEDAITENISRAEKKKKSRVVCHTHRVGSAHHARFDGIPVSVPIVAPQGLQILLANAAKTQNRIRGISRLHRVFPSTYQPI